MVFRKGVTVNVVAIMLILITVVMGIMLYTILWGPLTSKPPALEKVGAILVIEGGQYNGSYFILYVRNDGDREVRIVRAYIETPDGSVYVAKYPPTYGSLNVTSPSGTQVTLKPDRKAQEVVIGSFATSKYRGVIRVGESYAIKIIADDGSESSILVKVS